jgi:hypothetical protein
MPECTVVKYRIDSEDRLAEVNDAWTAFAESNAGEGVLPPSVLGRSLWSFIHDPTTSHLYQVMVKRLRAGGSPMRFRFRCDAPAYRRMLAMEMTCEDKESVWFAASLVEEQSRSAVRLLDSARWASHEILRMCAWCARIQLPSGTWAEAEVAIARLGLFDEASLPMLTHGMCEACVEAVTASVRDEADATGAAFTVGALPLAS